MSTPERYSIAPALLESLFNSRHIHVRISNFPDAPLQGGMLNVTTAGADHASMTVRLYGAPNQNQFSQTPSSQLFGMTQEMLDRVAFENGGPMYFADWTGLKLTLSNTDR